MKIPFRQGILRYQKDQIGNAKFLQKSNGGSSIDLVVSPDPTIITIAHRESNYIVEEGKTTAGAWTGFVSGTDYWLYLDIDLLTGARTFASCKFAPTFGLKSPTSPVIDMHWYDTNPTVMCMKVWNGTIWTEKLRVFVAKYKQGSIIEPLAYGTQINITASVDAGFILFDNEGKPVKRFYRRDAGEFFTTTSIFTTQTAKSVNVSLDAVNMTIAAAESMPAFALVTRDADDGYVRLADYRDASKPAIGMIQEDFYDGEVGIYTQNGYVYNEQWNWTQTPGTLLFLGKNGEISVIPTQTHTIQMIGEIVTRHSIRLNIQEPIQYDDPSYTQYQNLIPLLLDKASGKYVASNSGFTGGPGNGGGGTNQGYRHTQIVPDTLWTVFHNKHSEFFICQVFDADGEEIATEKTEVLDLNTIMITFADPQDGFVNVIFFEPT